jgi:signal transduction histidine kinase
MAIAYLIEWLYFPERWVPLTLCYGGFVVLSAVCAFVLRRLPEHALVVAIAGSTALAFTAEAYLALVHGSAQLCLLAMIGFLTGEVVQFPWGARGQAAATVGAGAAYVWALSAGASSELPAAYGLFALASHGVMTIVGAQLLDSYRFAAFREAAESARANAAKGEFLATVSHELRTPLNIIVGYTDLLLERAFTNAGEQHDALCRIQQNSRQLLDLIQSMLDLNRIEAGGVPLAVEEFSVTTAIDELRASLPANWCKPTVTLTWDTIDGAAHMRSDRNKLEMILRNLIHNALKYTEQGTVAVSVRADRHRGRVEFAVADTGLGIHSGDLAVIFDMFRQGANGGPPRGGGVGLGLYIVKRLTTALGGEIDVSSRLGAGSRFTVSLPLDLPHRG